jgi:ABC-type transport system involved in multi-copper enzyme maturation permease subunit
VFSSVYETEQGFPQKPSWREAGRSESVRYVGTVLRKELAEVANRKRLFLLRVVMTLSGFVATLIVFNDLFRYPPTYLGPYYLREGFMAGVFFGVIGFGLVTCAYCSTLVTAERSSRTLDVLICSPLRSITILLGKVLSRIGILLMIVLGVIPVGFLWMMVGGISATDLLTTSVVLSAAILYVSGISIFFSTITRSSASAFIATSIASCALLVPTAILSLFVLPGSSPATWSSLGSGFTEGAHKVLLFTNPIITLVVATEGATWGAAIWLPLTVCLLSNLVLFLLGTALASLLFERSREKKGQGVFRRLFVGKPARKPIRDRGNPIVWRESAFSILGRRKRLINPTAMLYICVFAAYIVWMLLLPDVWFYYDLGSYLHISSIRDIHMSVVLSAFGISLLATIVFAATSFTRDRSRGNVDELLVTPMATSELLYGKLKSVWWKCRHLYVLPLIHILLCIQLDLYEWTNLILFLPVSTCLIIFCSFLGVHFSTLFRTGAVALAATIVVMMILPILPIIVVNPFLMLGLSLTDTPFELLDNEASLFLMFYTAAHIIPVGAAVFIHTRLIRVLRHNLLREKWRRVTA